MDVGGAHPVRALIPPPRAGWALRLLLAVVIATTSVNAAFDLVRQGEPAAVIVLPDEPLPEERRAAEIITAHIEAMAGAAPPVISAGELGPEETRRPFWVGIGARLAAAGAPAPPGQPPGEEGILIWTTDEHAMLAGTDASGLRHGIYRFLEALGIRYLWPGESGKVIPKKTTVAAPLGLVSESPPLARRNIRGIATDAQRQVGPRGLLGLGMLDMDAESFLALRRDAAATALPDDGWAAWHGLGARRQFYYGHSFGDYWERFGQTHPQWFALQPNHSRSQDNVPTRPRLCKSNPELIQQAIADRLRILRENPERGGVSVGLNDGGANNWCMCESCRRLDPVDAPKIEMLDFTAGRRPFEYVSLTDRVLWFSNQVAEGVGEEFPDRDLGFYAYSHYREPPVRETPHPNLLIVYVGDDKEDFTAWSRFGNAMFYRPNTLLANRRVLVPQEWGAHLADFLRFAHGNGVVGTDYDSCKNHWALEGLTYYLLARAHWNPGEFDADAAIRDYCRTGFGPAAEPVEAYFRRLAEISRVARESDTDARVLHDAETIAGLREFLSQAGERAEQAGCEETAGRVAFLRAGLESGALRARLHAVETGGADREAVKKARMAYRENLRATALEHPLAVDAASAAFYSPGLDRD